MGNTADIILSGCISRNQWRTDQNIRADTEQKLIIFQNNTIGSAPMCCMKLRIQIFEIDEKVIRHRKKGCNRFLIGVQAVSTAVSTPASLQRFRTACANVAC